MSYPISVPFILSCELNMYYLRPRHAMSACKLFARAPHHPGGLCAGPDLLRGEHDHAELCAPDHPVLEQVHPPADTPAVHG